MTHPDDELRAAAAIHAARQELLQAVSVLACTPLDEHAAQRMRAALERVGSPAVKAALRRISSPAPSSRPFLTVVDTSSAGSRSAAAEWPCSLTAPRGAA
jgi:hypothetical protein